ncbi:hypothetical protein BDZ91DRAFT_768319 [Kalaharituber pfeilii]|nr:hypothetical protein BDZ91DRAFT_768319 [Kalaharituber pfeilii]
MSRPSALPRGDIRNPCDPACPLYLLYLQIGLMPYLAEAPSGQQTGPGAPSTTPPESSHDSDQSSVADRELTPESTSSEPPLAAPSVPGNDGVAAVGAVPTVEPAATPTARPGPRITLTSMPPFPQFESPPLVGLELSSGVYSSRHSLRRFQPNGRSGSSDCWGSIVGEYGRRTYTDASYHGFRNVEWGHHNPYGAIGQVRLGEALRVRPGRQTESSHPTAPSRRPDTFPALQNFTGCCAPVLANPNWHAHSAMPATIGCTTPTYTRMPTAISGQDMRTCSNRIPHIPSVGPTYLYPPSLSRPQQHQLGLMPGASVMPASPTPRPPSAFPLPPHMHGHTFRHAYAGFPQDLLARRSYGSLFPPLPFPHNNLDPDPPLPKATFNSTDAAIKPVHPPCTTERGPPPGLPWPRGTFPPATDDCCPHLDAIGEETTVASPVRVEGNSIAPLPAPAVEPRNINDVRPSDTNAPIASADRITNASQAHNSSPNDNPSTDANGSASVPNEQDRATTTRPRPPLRRRGGMYFGSLFVREDDGTIRRYIVPAANTEDVAERVDQNSGDRMEDNIDNDNRYNGEEDTKPEANNGSSGNEGDTSGGIDD